jgi:hypothetical protein
MTSAARRKSSTFERDQAAFPLDQGFLIAVRTTGWAGLTTAPTSTVSCG